MKTIIKTLAIASMVFLFLSTYAFAANVVVVTGQDQVITITGLDEDFDLSTHTDTSYLIRNGVVKVLAIVFTPHTTSDEMIIRDDGLNEAPIFNPGIHADAYDTRVLYFREPLECNPVIDISDCTLPVATNAKVMIYIAKPKP